MCPEEIERRMSHVLFYVVLTSQQFVEHSFFEETIQPDYHIAKVLANQIKLLRLERNEVDADDNVWEPFSGSTVYPYIDFDIVDLPKDYVNDSTWMTVHIELTHNHRVYTRKNYAIFDLIGDIEAVFSGLIDIFSVVCFVVFKFKVPQENSVINQIFRSKSLKAD
jgi:hypothetical protein